MRSLRTSWIVVVTRRRVLRMPVSRLVLYLIPVTLIGAFGITAAILQWREAYRAQLQDLSWARQRLAESRVLVQEQHQALSAVVGELAHLRDEALTLQSLKDQVRALGRLEGEHDISVQLTRLRPLETPLQDSATVMLGYAYEDLDLLRGVAQETSDTLSLLVALLEDESGIRPDIPSMWPVSGGVRAISSGFGLRRSPLTRRIKPHRGIDIRGRYGTPIRAAATGRVTYVGRDPGYGKLVVINHGSGIYTWYGHLSRMYVRKGQAVERGSRIGALGSTGRATGPHLHFEVRVNGRPVNPEQYLIN